MTKINLHKMTNPQLNEFISGLKTELAEAETAEEKAVVESYLTAANAEHDKRAAERRARINAALGYELPAAGASAASEQLAWAD